MKIATVGAFLITLFCTFLPASGAYPNDGSPLGMNISWVCDWNTEIPWVDMFMWFRGWEDGSSDSLPSAQLDSCGWVKYLNAGQVANVGHGAGTRGHFPGGDYILTWEGEGTIGTRSDCRFKSYDSLHHTAVVTVDSMGSMGWYGLSITSTTPGNYVRNMHLIMPGFADTWQTDIWHPQFVQKLQRFKTLRFMDVGATNGSNVVNWSDVKPGYWWNQSASDDRACPGQLSPLWMIRMCNRLHADGWFCIPAKANDDCVLQYAKLLHDSLASDLKIYIEYSNECWNWSFSQTGYCTNQGKALGLTSPASGGAVTGGPAEYYALRSSQIWRIFESVFGTNSPRLEKVLAGQQGSEGMFESAMFPILDNPTLNPDNEQPTALAIAPYFVNDHSDGTPGTYILGTVDSMLHDVINKVLPAKRAADSTMAAYAHSKGCKLLGYESGQSFYGTQTAYTKIDSAAQEDPLMRTVYLQYLRDWFAVGGGMINHYAFCNLDGNLYWGSIEYYDEQRSQAPKYDALLTFIEDTTGIVISTGVRPQSGFSALRTAAITKSMQPLRIFSLSGRLVGTTALVNRIGAPIFGQSASGVYVFDKEEGVGFIKMN